jgi:hypothetical protein
MIPLMMSQDFKPKGWLGLILGTRVWYGFWDADQDDAAAFESRVDAVMREVGDRGKLVFSEGVPPLHEPTPAPAPAPAALKRPAPAPAPAPDLTPAAAATPAPAPAPATPQSDIPAVDRSFTPTIRQSPASLTALETQQQQQLQTQAQGQTIYSNGSFEAMSAFLNEQQDRHNEACGLLRGERDAAEAKLEQQRQVMEAELRKRLPQAAAEAISEEQLEALQARLQRLHSESQQLLSEEELGNLEDTIADCIEVLLTADVTDRVVGQTLRMVLLSEKMKADGPFARQMRRKFT